MCLAYSLTCYTSVFVQLQAGTGRRPVRLTGAGIKCLIYRSKRL